MDNKFFAKSDGWLFATVKLMNKRKLILKHILSTGDTLNHSLFTLEEINEGLSRLESEKFIEIIDNKIFLTKTAKNFIKDNHKRFELCIDEQVRYCKLFEEMPLQNEVLYKEYFNQSEYETALKKYSIYPLD